MNLKTLTYLYIAVLFLLAILPINGSESVLNNNYLFYIRWDYLLHALVYVPLYPMMRLSGIKLLPLNLIFIVVIIATTFEAVQYLIPWRTFNINDLVGNVLGVGIGVMFWIILTKKFTFVTYLNTGSKKIEK